ncbi:MAG: CPBP family intramembrane metalloprotease [Flavihumibacter sp.]
MPILPAWTRVVLFLLVYLLLQLALGMLQPGIFLYFCSSCLLSVLLVAGFTRVVDNTSFRTIGLQRKGSAREAALGAATAIIMLAVIPGTLLALQQLRYTGAHWNTAGFLVSFLLMALVAFAEELVFRGYVLRNLLTCLPKHWALLLSALVFAFFHAANPGAAYLPLLNVFLAGCLLGIRYIFCQNLWFGVGLHFCWNFFQGPVLGFAVSGLPLPSILQPVFGSNRLLTGGAFGIEGSVISSVTFLLFILVFYINRPATKASNPRNNLPF